MLKLKKPDWIKGAMILALVQEGPDKVLMLNVYMPHAGDVTVTIQVLDSQRSPLCDLNGVAVKPVRVVATATDVTASPALERRVREVIGDIPLHRTACTLSIPGWLSPAASFLQIEVEQPTGNVDAELLTVKKPEDRICLEIPKRTLSKVGCSTLHFLSTRKQANYRIEQIARKYGLFKRNDDATNEALVNLVFAFLSGADSPLITEHLEDEDDE